MANARKTAPKARASRSQLIPDPAWCHKTVSPGAPRAVPGAHTGPVGSAESLSSESPLVLVLLLGLSVS